MLSFFVDGRGAGQLLGDLSTAPSGAAAFLEKETETRAHDCVSLAGKIS